MLHVFLILPVLLAGAATKLFRRAKGLLRTLLPGS